MEQKQESDFWSSPEGKKLNYARVHSSSEPATPSIEMAGPEDPFAMMSTPLPEDEDSPTKKYGTRSRDKDGQRVLDTFSPGKKRKDRDGSGELGTLVRTQKAVSKRVRMAESLEGGIDDLEAEVQG